MARRGLDISHWAYDARGLPIGWLEIKRLGYEFIYLKASDGFDISHANYNYGKIDPFFIYEWEHVLSLFKAGAYHFWRTTLKWDYQFSIFDAAMFKPPTLPSLLDLEEKTFVAGLKLWDVIHEWLKAEEAKRGLKPAIYTGRGWLNWAVANYGPVPLWMAEHLLYLADYNPTPKPIIPLPWKQYWIRQVNEGFHVPGIPGGVSLDLMEG
jgi:GH25 family lysozyme M1 (1,4-beta-N-acetylmuramidase)